LIAQVAGPQIEPGDQRIERRHELACHVVLPFGAEALHSISLQILYHMCALAMISGDWRDGVMPLCGKGGIFPLIPLARLPL
jgi:hypothetical protein